MSHPTSFFATDDFAPQASEIIPRLYISDLQTAQSRSTLAALGITHVVSCMRGVVELPLPVRAHQVPVDDLPFAELGAHLPHAVAFIAAALAQSPGTRVLVHCVKGVSRSASVVAAYLVAARGCSVPQAIDAIAARRRVALPNAGFKMQLEEYAVKLRQEGR